jgi:hypothetical protein
MRVTAWKNGKHSSRNVAYGLSIPKDSRDRFFDRHWREVILTMPGGEEMTASLTPTFWTTCNELRGAPIGRWLRSAQLAPWPKGTPPSLELTHQRDNRFTVRLPSDR